MTEIKYNTEELEAMTEIHPTDEEMEAMYEEFLKSGSFTEVFDDDPF